MNYTLDELLRIVDFSTIEHGDQIKNYLDQCYTDEEFEAKVSEAYDEGEDDGSESKKEEVKDLLLNILDNSDLEGDELLEAIREKVEAL